MRVIFKLIFVLFLLTSSLVSAQSANRGREMLLKYIDTLCYFKTPDNEKVYFMDYTVNTKYKEALSSGDKNKSIRFKVYLAKNLLVNESEYVSMYYDNTDLLIALHPQKVIKWNKGVKFEYSEDRWNQYVTIQKELMNICQYESVKKVLYNEDSVQLITATIPSEYKDKFKVVKIQFWYNDTKTFLNKIRIEYNPDMNLQNEEIVYNELSFDYKKFKPQPAYRYIINKDGSRNKQFNGYKIIDSDKQ